MIKVTHSLNYSSFSNIHCITYRYILYCDYRAVCCRNTIVGPSYSITRKVSSQFCRLSMVIFLPVNKALRLRFVFACTSTYKLMINTLLQGPLHDGVFDCLKRYWEGYPESCYNLLLNYVPLNQNFPSMQKFNFSLFCQYIKLNHHEPR